MATVVVPPAAAATPPAAVVAPRPPSRTLPARRAYTIEQVCAILSIPRRSFFHLRKAGGIPCLVELIPRLGRIVRYRAADVDRYADGQWGQPRAFSSHRRSA